MTSALLRRAVRSTSLAPRSLLIKSPSCALILNCRLCSTDGKPRKAENEESKKQHPQSFVTTELEPGEWDEFGKDPLHRPKYRSRARIISAEDYANRNRVSFEEQYSNFADAMVTLSWLDQATQKRIYQLYLNWMVSAQEKYGKTSHEYICRVLGEKFHITPFRVAAVIQLQHNEEQYKLNEPERPLLIEEAKGMENFIKETIKLAYKSTGEVPPEAFVEPADGFSGKQESVKTTVVDDIFDADQLMEDAYIREQERAKMMINDHIYIEDVDENKFNIPVSKDVRELVKQKEKLQQQQQERQANPVPSPTAANATKEESRPRWKYVAQAINTHDLDPKSKLKHYKDGKVLRGRKHRMRFQHDWAENTLVEHDGELRLANMAEVRKTSWRPVRHVQEFTYARLKEGWLDRTVRKKRGVWGKKPVYEGRLSEQMEKEQQAAENESNAKKADDEEDSDSGSSGDKSEEVHQEPASDESEGDEKENPEAKASVEKPQETGAAKDTAKDENVKEDKNEEEESAKEKSKDKKED